MKKVCMKKVCAIFNNLIGIPTKQTDIEVAHRTGQPSGSKDRPILIQFFDRKIRDSVLRNRRRLRGTGPVIREDLTHANYRLDARQLQTVSKGLGISGNNVCVEHKWQGSC